MSPKDQVTILDENVEMLRFECKFKITIHWTFKSILSIG